MKIFKRKIKIFKKTKCLSFIDWVVNKTIEKDADKFSTKCSRYNLDKSIKFIFDDSEEKIDAKILRNEELF